MGWCAPKNEAVWFPPCTFFPALIAVRRRKRLYYFILHARRSSSAREKKKGKKILKLYKKARFSQNSTNRDIASQVLRDIIAVHVTIGK